MNISEISIRNPVFAWMLMAFLIVFGAISFQRMGVSQFPDVDFPVVTISVTLTGASPEVMEVDVADPIENVLTSIQGIKNISSSSKTGVTSITVEFELNKNIDVAVQDIQNALAQVQNKLPKDIDPPVTTRSNSDASPILWLAISSDEMPAKDLMALVRDKIKDRFTTISGVGNVILGGYVEPNLRVWINPKKLAERELSPDDVIQAIQAGHSELPAGQIDDLTRETDIRTMGEAKTPQEFGEIALERRGGAPNYLHLKLKDVAAVEEGLNDVRRKSWSNGVQAVGLGIQKQPGSNAVEIAHAVKQRVEEVRPELPKNVTIGMRFDSTVFIEDSMRELEFTLILAALLTAIVCLFFLGSWSATMNVILAIPTSIVGSFIILYAFDFTLNFFTMLGLTLAIGIVVDDAIMVLENIVRHRELGKSRVDAALAGSKEIMLAAVAATAAIIAIYLPVAFMQGIIGRFFFQFGVTLTLAVAISLLEALTLAPMRCAQFLDVHERKTFIGRAIDTGFNGLANLYGRVVGFILRFRVFVVFISIAAFAASLLLVGLLKKEFVPSQDQSTLMVRFLGPVGSSLSYTEKRFAEVEKIVTAHKEVAGYYGLVGGFGGGDLNSGFMFLSLQPKSQRPLNPKTGKATTQQELAVILRDELSTLPDLKISMQDPSLSGFTAKRGYPIEFTVRGPDYLQLITLSTTLMEGMQKSGKMTDIDSNYRGGSPELHIVPNRAKAQQYAVEIAKISQAVQMMMGGVIAGQYTSNSHRSDVRVRLGDSDRASEEALKHIRVRNTRGEMVPLLNLVTVNPKNTLQNISRENRERAISIFANPSPTSSQAEAIEEVERLASQILPQNYHVVLSGSAQTFVESFQGLLLALVLGIVVSYMVLASQFNSFIHPITVLVALPFSISGALIALYLGKETINIYSLIGILLLMGIVKKNSILLVDFTNRMRKEGYSVNEALIRACPIRLRPILMTSLATIAAALPPAFAAGPGAESRIPMAVAVLGGVALSTFLTLFAVPCVYSLFAHIERKE